VSAPYYEQDGIAIYRGDVREWYDLPEADVMVTDPPYGIAYKSGQFGTLPRSIQGDADTSLRTWALGAWGDRPALVFGSWKAKRPDATRMLLVWDTKGANGMGDLSLPWKPSHQEIYVLGEGFVGRRTTDVLSFAPVQSMAANGRVHPHEKPVPLMCELIGKCPPGVVIDPFVGSGTTLVAAQLLGRKAIGIEIEERYCEIAAKRLAQGVLL
jgi:site-specific DNA-methyltransferase (adenine-specific)